MPKMTLEKHPYLDEKDKEYKNSCTHSQYHQDESSKKAEEYPWDLKSPFRLSISFFFFSLEELRGVAEKKNSQNREGEEKK
jgi:hypothetical protein